jgi:hypothetical protein
MLYAPMRTFLSLHRYGRHRGRRYAQFRRWSARLRFDLQHQALHLGVFLERLSRLLGQPRLSPT